MSFIRIIVFAVLVFLIEFYFIFKLKNSFKTVLSKKTEKIFPSNKLIISFLIFFNIYPAFLIVNWSYSILTNTPVLIPSNFLFDYLVIYPFWFYIIIAVQCILFYLILDIIKFLIYPIYKKYKSKLSLLFESTIFVIFIIFLFYVPLRILYDYNKIIIKTINYYNANLPEQLNNFKIAFISDIHADRYTDANRLSKFVSLVNKQHPQLVLAGGDFISSTPDYIYQAAKFIGQIKSKYGIYSCVGDHDVWAYRKNAQKSLNEVIHALAINGIKMIDNGNLTLRLDDQPVRITFITNTYTRRTNPLEIEKIASDVSKNVFKIFIIHQPEGPAIKIAEKNNYNLLLAGHTHGGQITFLFPFKNISPTMLETKYVKGVFHLNKMTMIVTNGLGMSLLPIRYNSTPEITIINLRKK